MHSQPNINLHPTLSLLTKLKALGLALLAVASFSVVATGGCSNSSTPAPQPSSGSPTPIASVSPTASPSPTSTPVNFIIMNYSSIPPTTDPTYGQVDGYAAASAAPSASPLPTVSSQIITVHCNQTIEFYNLDRVSSHTASLLGVANGMNWPPNFNNINGASNASVLLTPISSNQFSTGNLAPLGSGFNHSLVYSTGPTAGSFYFGDYYDYTPQTVGFPSMRTVITVVCP